MHRHQHQAVERRIAVDPTIVVAVEGDLAPLEGLADDGHRHVLPEDVGTLGAVDRPAAGDDGTSTRVDVGAGLLVAGVGLGGLVGVREN